MSSAPEFGDAVVEGLLEGAVVADVGLGGDDPAVQGLDFLDRLGQVVRRGHRVWHRIDLGGQIDRDDVRALLSQPDRVRAALAASRAGDEGDLALYSSHDALPFVVSGAAIAYDRVHNYSQPQAEPAVLSSPY